MYPPPSASLDKHPWNQWEQSWGTLGRSQHARFWGKNQEAKSPIGAIFSCSGHHPKPYRNRSNGLIITLPIAFACFGKMHQLWDKARHHKYQVDYILIDVIDITMFLFDYIILPCEWWMSYRHIWCFKLQWRRQILCQVPAGPILTPQATRRSPDDESVDSKNM